MPYDLRAARAALDEAAPAALAVEWVAPDQADAVLVLQTMATAGLDARRAELAAGGGLGRPRRGAAGRLRPRHHHERGATVGAPMLTSLLVRAGRPFELVLGRIDDPKTASAVSGALVAATAARRLSSARIGCVGAPLEGYNCVDTDADLLRRATGTELVAIDPAEVRELYRTVDDALDRSLRAAYAIDDLVARYDLGAGAVNSHAREIRFGDEIGIIPSVALRRTTINGVPWPEVGDVLTAVAVLAGKLLGGAARSTTNSRRSTTRPASSSWPAPASSTSGSRPVCARA